ncbi:hypothetical protein EPR50_G00178780 [Perca flavescens]|uniref:Uncharacterized protein n=1 Tax=Perca flavescens TaxID=8167 RepID=A0A484CJM3_PERFV|nr:hypothetical protein EPR50_G00178780 [Perca flavescens]
MVTCNSDAPSSMGSSKVPPLCPFWVFGSVFRRLKSTWIIFSSRKLTDIFLLDSLDSGSFSPLYSTVKEVACLPSNASECLCKS